MAQVKGAELEAKVKEMYREVAENPGGTFHFEMGRRLAEKLGYPSEELDRVPAEAIESFAGVGFHFDLAGIKPGESVIDLRSGSGMDAFVASLRVIPGGKVCGVDMTNARLAKAERLRGWNGFAGVFPPGLSGSHPI
jgi:hypothetical protein